MLRTGLAMLVAAFAAGAGAAEAAPDVNCDEMVARLDAYLKAHPNATGALRQTTGAQLMHQPTRQSVDEAKKQARENLVALLAKAKAAQSAGDEKGCLASLAEAQWMLLP